MLIFEHFTALLVVCELVLCLHHALLEKRGVLSCSGAQILQLMRQLEVDLGKVLAFTCISRERLLL